MPPESRRGIAPTGAGVSGGRLFRLSVEFIAREKERIRRFSLSLFPATKIISIERGLKLHDGSHDSRNREVSEARAALSVFFLAGLARRQTSERSSLSSRRLSFYSAPLSTRAEHNRLWVSGQTSRRLLPRIRRIRRQ